METNPKDMPDQTERPETAAQRMPRGLPYIVANEAAERYSFYGMRSILTVFMTVYLLRHSGEPDWMTENEARIWYHTFVMGVYFLPIIGAILSDVFWGKYKTIISLSLVYCLGHLVLALDQTRLGLSIGLTLIAIGAGGIKPCVSAHLGDQFDRNSSPLLDRAYAWFYFAINIGSFVSILLGERLLVQYGPHVAFGLPGALMLLATWIFFLGRKKYQRIPPVGWANFQQTLREPDTRRALLRILPVFGLVAVFWALYDQTGSSWVLQAKSDLMDKNLRFFGWSVALLPSQIQVINPALILVFVPLFSVVLYPLADRLGLRTTPLRKIGLGFFLAALSFALIAGLEFRIFQNEPVSVNGQFWAYVALSAGEVLISMTCLEFAYTQAPNPAKSLVMGMYYLSLSAGNLLAVEVNHLIQHEVHIDYLGQEEPDSEVRFRAGPRMLSLIEGRKIMISGPCGLNAIVPHPVQGLDTVSLQGTFILQSPKMNERSFSLAWSDSREPVQLIGTYQPREGHKVYVERLIGAEYFWFFSGLAALAGLIFIPVARRYPMARYIQAHPPEHMEWVPEP